MLEEEGVPYRYRDYRQDPLSEEEIRRLVGLLDVHPGELLRTRDKAYWELGLNRDDEDEVLIGAMAEHPTLLQRPIGVLGERAVVGRPPERLLELVDERR